jgi:hypothetical protein
LSRTAPSPKSLKNTVTQTLGETVFDFVTFSARVYERADIRASRRIWNCGLRAYLSRTRRNVVKMPTPRETILAALQAWLSALPGGYL